MGLNLRKIGQTIGNVVSSGVKDVGNAGSLLAADVTGNQQAQQNASQALHNSIAPAANFVTQNIIDPIAQFPIDASSQLYNRAVAPAFNLPRLNNGQTSLNPLIQQAAKKVGATGSLHQTLASGAQTGLAIGSGGLGDIIENGAVKALPGVANTIIPKVVSDAALGAGFNASAAAGQGATPGQIVQAGALGAGLGGAAPVAGAIAKPIVKLAADSRTPLNQVGGINNIGDEQIPNKVPSPAPAKTTSVSGVKLKTGVQGRVGEGIPIVSAQDKQIFKSMGGNPNDLPNLLKLNNTQKADLDSGTQMALDKFQQVNHGLAPAEENTAKNPFKSMLQAVNQGDYGQAIANGQVASKPIDVATMQWQNAMKRLNPEETKNFWKSVEDPDNPDHSSNVREAISRWNQATNRVHANSQALGGNTNYVTNYARHPWELPEELTDGGINGAGKNFSGLNNVSRKYQTIAEGEQAGLKLSQNPVEEGTRFLKASSSALRREALKQGLSAADSGAEAQPHTLDLGFGHTVQLSDEGRKAAKGVEFRPPTSNGAVKVVRKGQQNLKTGLLSASQFHPVNISLLRAAPTLAAEGHPIAAIKGGLGTFRGIVGNKYTDRLISKAVEDGTADKAALIGAPYGSTETGGFSLGEHTVFGKQMPVMHDQVVRSVLSDLEKNGIPLNSSAARQAGDTANKLMGFMNAETNRISPRVQQGMRDFLLAGQFTPSKFGIAKTALTKGGVGGSYARRTIAANVGALAAVGGGIGYLMHQKSDDTRDTLLRAIFDPAVATPLKDDKGNTEKLRLPGGDTSDFAKLLGFKLVRGQDGHLDVNWKPGNMPSTIEDYLRARLAPGASAVVKLATNTTFAGKPLFDPNAPLGQKAEQAATSLITGQLPIGLQGVPMINSVEKHLPGSVQEVLNAQKPGSNPLVKSLGSSFGLTPSTDTTAGKGQQSAQYYDVLDQVKQGLNRQEKDALDLYAGSKKNPVTGKYDINPNANDARVKATTLLQNPKVIGNLIAMNQKLAQEGQKTDPLWTESKDNITKYLQYSAMLPGSADKTNWFNNNQSWYSPLATARNTFFGSLPAGDPNKPKLDLQYPDASPQVTDLENQYNTLTDSKQKAAFLTANPSLVQQWDKQAVYTNQFREALGASPLKDYPASTPYVDKQLAAKNYKDPQVQAYLDKVSEYNVIKGGANAQFQGTQLSQSALKGVENLANYGIVQNPDGSLVTVGSGLAQPGAVSANKYAGNKSKYYIRAHSSKPYIKRASLGRASKPKTAKIAKAGFKPKTLGFAPKGTPKAPKVSLKSSAV